MTCQGLFGRLFGHKYEARSSKGEPMSFQFKTGIAEEIIKVLEATKPINYHHDICTRCGHVVNKGETK